MNFKLVAALGGLIAGAVTSLKNTFDTKAPAEDNRVQTVQPQIAGTVGTYAEANADEYLYSFNNIIVDYRQIYFISRGTNDNAFIHFYDGGRDSVDTGEKFDEVRKSIHGDE